MRRIVDKLVTDFYNNNLFRKPELESVERMNPGNVRALNDCTFLPYRKAKGTSVKERLVDAVSRMPGDTYKQKYCMAILSQANIGSVYISLASQYALYKIVTEEVEPCDIATYISDAGLGTLASSLNIKVLENIVDDIMEGLEEGESGSTDGASNLEVIAGTM